jgi:hypothetical protein
MRNINPFVIKTLILCTILFTLTTLAHGLAIAVRDSSTVINPDDYETDYRNKERQDDQNESSWDITPFAQGVGDILAGLDMPMPLPIIIIIWNVVLLTIIAYDVSEIIKAWIPIL